MIDKRTKKYRTLHLWFNQYTRAALVAGLILGSLIGFSLKQERQTSLEAPQAMIQQVVADEPSLEYYMAEPIRWIRYRGEQLGFENQDITKAIRIARCESNFNQYAKNPQSTAKGIYQFIDGTWRANCLKDGNVYNFVDNINCFWKVYKTQGDRPWRSSQRCWQ